VDELRFRTVAWPVVDGGQAEGSAVPRVDARVEGRERDRRRTRVSARRLGDHTRGPATRFAEEKEAHGLGEGRT